MFHGPWSSSACFGASFNAVRVSTRPPRARYCRGRRRSCSCVSSASSLGRPHAITTPHLHSARPEPQLSAKLRGAVLLLAGLDLWSRGDCNKKEMLCVCVSVCVTPLEHLGHSTSACGREGGSRWWEAFVVQIRDFFLFLLFFSLPSFPPPSKGCCVSSQAACMDNPGRTGGLPHGDVWVFRRDKTDALCALFSSMGLIRANCM